MHSLKRFIPATFVVLWATGFIGARYAMPWVEPFTFLAARFVLAALILILLMLIFRSRKATLKEALHAGGVGILMQGMYLGGVFWAVHKGMPAGLAGLIAGLQPLITAALSGTFLGEQIVARQWTGLAVGFVGGIIVLWPKLGALGSGVNAHTLAACVLAVVAISVGTIWQKRLASGVDLITTTFWQYVGGALVMALASLAFETHKVVINGELVFAMTWLVLVLSIGAIFLLMVMIREGEMSKVASLFYLVPVVTAIMAWALFGENLNLVQIFGMVVTTFGVGLATARTSGFRRRPAPVPRGNG